MILKFMPVKTKYYYDQGANTMIWLFLLENSIINYNNKQIYCAIRDPQYMDHSYTVWPKAHYNDQLLIIYTYIQEVRLKKKLCGGLQGDRKKGAQLLGLQTEIIEKDENNKKRGHRKSEI